LDEPLELEAADEEALIKAAEALAAAADKRHRQEREGVDPSFSELKNDRLGE
jgi:hypothetical protein